MNKLIHYYANELLVFSNYNGYNKAIYEVENYLKVEIIFDKTQEFSKTHTVDYLNSIGTIVSITQSLYEEIRYKVEQFTTKYKQGFIKSEIEKLYKEIENKYSINRDKFNEALNGITCTMINDEIITYYSDIETALLCGIEDSDITLKEFD